MSLNTNSEAAEQKKSLLKRLLPLVILAGAALLVISQGWHNYLTLEQLAHNREQLKTFIGENYLLALGTYAAIYITAVALSLPGGLLLTLTGGLLFGWVVGGAVTVLAATIGATIIFLIAKTVLGEPLAAKAGPRLGKLRAGFQEDALSYLLFLRLVPAFPFWLVNLAPGLLGVKLRTYVIGTLIGIMPGTFAFSYVGVGLDSIIDAQQRSFDECLASADAASKVDAECSFTLDPSALLTKEILIAFAALGLVALIPVFLKKYRKKHSVA